MSKILVITGAGISKESGIPTYRDDDPDSIWEKWDHDKVATPRAWKINREHVLKFYNEVREMVRSCKPNEGHRVLTRLQDRHKVNIVTQNVDDLHERAGSKNVLHVHGSLFRSRSTYDPKLKYEIEDKLDIGDRCEKGSQLRPDVVWFGEQVPLMSRVIELLEWAEIVIFCGTSLQVYPMCSIVDQIDKSVDVYLVDPNKPEGLDPRIKFIQKPATVGMLELEQLLS